MVKYPPQNTNSREKLTSKRTEGCTQKGPKKRNLTGKSCKKIQKEMINNTHQRQKEWAIGYLSEQEGQC